MTSLKRITTEYVPQQDRIRLSGERDDSAAPLALWLTQRLFNRMLPVLLQWLERQGRELPRAETLQSFAQQAAGAKLTPQPPVRVDSASEEWLIQSVDVGSNDRLIRLTFKAEPDQAANLAFTAEQLRQWLCILHVAWIKAEWPGNVWPEWVRENTPTVQQDIVLH